MADSQINSSQPRDTKLGQIESNYLESWQFLLSRKRRQVNQLVLLSNLQRQDQTIASTLLLTLFNRVLASVYDDKIQVKFLPSQGILQEQLNSYNVLAESDYQEMGKAKIDYDWMWDTGFFGRGYLETYQFDTKRKIMKPHVINPLVLGYDPYMDDPQDWRYYWKWLTKSKYQINALIKAGKITGITSADEIAGGIDPYLWEYKMRRDAAAKGVQPPIEPAAADVYQILEYFGYDEDGKKCIYWIDKYFSKVLLKEELDLDDMEGEEGQKLSKWPIVIKEMFRVPHSSIPFSIADIIEDKHRAESVVLNLLFIGAKDSANPLYWYDPDKVKDVSQFLSRQVDQHIPVEGDGAMAVGPINTKNTFPAEVVNFLTALRSQANDPVGTGVAAAPETGGKGTATEAAIDQQLNDMAQSLFSKVLQFGEQEFWSQWFHRYQKHGPELKTKMANIVGVKGITSTEIDFSDFDTPYPPGVMVYSAKEAEYKNMVKRRDWMSIMPDLQATMTKDSFDNWMKHVFLPLMIEDPSLIDVMLPKSLEEMKAEEQNQMLSKDENPPVLDTDDHTTHLYIHRMVQPKTWATWFHIMEHEDALAKQVAQQQAQAMLQSPQQGPATPGQPPGAGKPGQAGPMPGSSPMAAASPLKDNAATPTNINQ